MAVREHTYHDAGVDTDKADAALSGILASLAPTLSLRQGVGRVALPNGFFANVIDVGSGIGIAISTDGVGSKVLVAQALGKFDTIGIDCVAMNANDVLCVGAEPLSLVDYIAVQAPSPDLLTSISVGLAEGARRANISIPGGEISQLPEVIRGLEDRVGFDIVGTCIGTVPIDRIIDGSSLIDGDVIVGLPSTGIHSNGLTLARKVLFDDGGFSATSYVTDLAAKVGEVLLEPTRIYVKDVLEMLAAGLKVKALAHMTSDGFLNLTRVKSDASFRIARLPDPQPIFQLIQDLGNISDSEMFRTYNMGIGFCVVIAESDAPEALRIASKYGYEPMMLGHVVNDGLRQVYLEPRGLVGKGKHFQKR